ncbi:CBO0543 family protein [Oceanobacillus salinisoli]|uniref:CBO0543 family protein n=1 Tax=Oceanobacillus salinisoli TaxID=2678611 RepID=UPI0012E32220|nr:CBO0543 family protein [Oceanobacillus salinisoli]
MQTDFINVGFHIEFFVHITVIIIGFLGLLFFLKLDPRRYGLLFILATLVGNILCFIFVKLNFYLFPYVLFPAFEFMPISAVTLSFPILVLFAVRYSPKQWGWKIPFYWTIVHIGVFIETWALTNTLLIQYDKEWDLWDSYTW